MIEDLIAVSEVRSVPKNTVLYWGQPDDKYMYFLVEGVCRAYMIEDSGEERTVCLDTKPGLMIAASASLKPEKTDIICETATETTVVAVTYENIGKMFKKHPIICGSLYTKYLGYYLNHNFQKSTLLRKNAAERYEWFSREYPGVIDRINNHYIASFLGMTNFTLSRVKNKEKI